MTMTADFAALKVQLQAQREHYEAELARIDPAATLAQADELDAQWRALVPTLTNEPEQRELMSRASALRAKAEVQKDQRAQLEQRIVEADRLIDSERVLVAAKSAADLAARAVEAARERVAAAQATHERLQRAHDDEVQALALAHRVQVQSLMDAALAGGELDTTPTAAMGTHRRDALALALEQAAAAVESARADEAKAEQSADQAQREAHRARLGLVELEHTAALIDYAPKLATFIAQYREITGYEPDVDPLRMAREILEDMRDRAAAQRQARGARR